MGIRRVRVVDPYDLKATEQVVTEELAAEEPSVIITRRPLRAAENREKASPYRVDPDQCKGCKLCMRIGCPAISWKEKKAVIDPTQCVGCGVCEQLCTLTPSATRRNSPTPAQPGEDPDGALSRAVLFWGITWPAGE